MQVNKIQFGRIPIGKYTSEKTSRGGIQVGKYRSEDISRKRYKMGNTIRKSTNWKIKSEKTHQKHVSQEITSGKYNSEKYKWEN